LLWFRLSRHSKECAAYFFERSKSSGVAVTQPRRRQRRICNQSVRWNLKKTLQFGSQLILMKILLLIQLLGMHTDNIAFTELGGGAITDPNNISLNVNVPAISPTQAYVFARIGLKIAGVEDRIFSPVQKLTY
jgi:hypothetical protein